MIFSETSEITFVLTSCDRFDLLRRTLETFDFHNTAPLRHAFIVEDSGREGVYDCLPSHWVTNSTVIVNRCKLGQLASIDRVYEQVSTPWVFHCEDDWEFYRPGFIEDSIALLSLDPCALQVWLRSIKHDLSIHNPYIKTGPRLLFQQIPHYRVHSDNQDWQGFSFNPGVRRTADYRTHAPYAQHGSEKKLSRLYGSDGRYALVLENDAVLHTGFNCHVERDTDRANKRRRKRYERLRVILGFVGGMVLSTLICWLSVA